jgi:hypothetical protein
MKNKKRPNIETKGDESHLLSSPFSLLWLNDTKVTVPFVSCYSSMATARIGEPSDSLIFSGRKLKR